MTGPRAMTFSATIREDGTATITYMSLAGEVHAHEVNGLGAQMIREAYESWITAGHIAALLTIYGVEA